MSVLPFQESRRIAPGLLRDRFQLSIFLAMLWICAILLRLVFVQVVQHEHFVQRAGRQWQSTITLYPERGAILDQKGDQLAVSIDVDSVYAMPEEMKDRDETLARVARAAEADPKEIIQKAQDKSFIWVARRIPDEQAAEIRRMNLPGIYLTKESRRYYPNKDLAAHVVGFVGLDNKGLSGIEYQYDDVVTGIPGKLVALRDAKRRLLLPSGGSSTVPPSVGRTLQLTIDRTIQHIAEEELRAGIREQKASGGSVIIMNPYTGDILAMANEPTFNPNAYTQYDRSLWKNRAVQDYYEPGSTFKPVIAAAALDRRLVDPDRMFDCQWGSITIAGHVIKDHKPFGTLSFRQIIENSSNVGTIKIGMIVGPPTIVRYANLFGFNQRTGIDLPAESPGFIRPPERWSAISVGAVSIGQEVGVTPLQILRMITAIGNGGFLVAPRCLAKMSDSSGELKPVVFQQPQALPLEHNTITTLQSFLEGVVKKGSGTLADIPGYTIAGKTGTAEKIGRSGSYADGGYIASFAGYGPVKQPAFSMIVVIVEPKVEHYGGRVAAPIFRRIGQQVLKYLDIPPEQIPDNPALQADSAFPRGLQAKTKYPEGLEPVAYAPPPELRHKPVTAPDDGEAGGLVMPYLYGKTAGEAIAILSKMKAEFRMIGSGTVIKQFPAPGRLLAKDDLIIITLSTAPGNSTNVSELDAVRK